MKKNREKKVFCVNCGVPFNPFSNNPMTANLKLLFITAKLIVK